MQFHGPAMAQNVDGSEERGATRAKAEKPGQRRSLSGRTKAPAQAFL